MKGNEKAPGAADKEYNAQGKEEEGGGYTMKGGDLIKKSADLKGDDLQKSLDLLEEFAAEGDEPTRKEALLTKAQEGELSKAEKDELFQVLGGGGEPTTPAEDSDLSKALTDNPSLQKAVDVSAYLKENHDALVKSLDAVGEEISKADNRRHQFNMILAKAVSDIGTMVKSMSERMGMIEAQPVRGPKARGVQGASPAQVLHKSFANVGNGPGPDGGDGGSEVLSKSETLDGLDMLMEESMSKGRKGHTSSGGNILTAIAKYEQLSLISPAMNTEVQRIRQANTN